MQRPGECLQIRLGISHSNIDLRRCLGQFLGWNVKVVHRGGQTVDDFLEVGAFNAGELCADLDHLQAVSAFVPGLGHVVERVGELLGRVRHLTGELEQPVRDSLQLANRNIGCRTKFDDRLLKVARFPGELDQPDTHRRDRADSGRVEDRIRAELLHPTDRIRGVPTGFRKADVRGLRGDHRVDMFTLRAGQHRIRRRRAAAVLAVLRGRLSQPALIPDHAGRSVSLHIRGAAELLLQRQKLTPSSTSINRGERFTQM